MYQYHKLFSTASLGAAFDATVTHQAAHGRVAHVLVQACANEYRVEATDKHKAMSLQVPETKLGFSKFSERFIGAATNAGKARVYPVSRSQGAALCAAFAAVREGLGLPAVDVGAAWQAVAKAPKAAKIGDKAPAAGPEASEAPAAGPEASEAPAAAPAAAPADGGTLSQGCIDVVSAIHAGVFNTTELDAIMRAIMDVADVVETTTGEAVAHA